MQGIYEGYEIMAWDHAWTCALDMVQDINGDSWVSDVFLLLESGSAGEIWKE